ncbi:globin domain-containing protein [Amycolatopsis sacchari]|uniref:globin domain-containing protein n=1 Tax=Amycolatopsis sacchari TaxID=115433 RepID=UPI003D713378
MDTARLRSSWNTVAGFGGGVPLFFYSTLFLTRPHLRELFPAGMSAQRDKLVRALGRVVASVDELDAAVPFLRQLGRDHRKFAVTEDHYPAVGQALLTTLEHFLGEEWTPELAADWAAAYKIVADVMTAAAKESAHTTPAWWNGEVLRHERRGLDTAVLTIRTDRPLGYRAGQSVSVETALRPRIWRYYSPATAPREDNLLELHVRMVDGGTVSSALVQAVRPGDVLRLGAPVGSRLTIEHEQDVVLIAGGTGLAPFKALLGQIANEPLPSRRVELYVGARTARELYDLPALRALASALPELRVVPVVSDDPAFRGPRGPVGEVAVRHGPWPGREIYVCGSPAMVSATRNLLAGAGIAAEHVHWEDFSGYQDPAEAGVGFLTRG